MKTYHLHITSETELGAFAAAVAPEISTAQSVLLQGDLGTGKTSFARAFIRARCGNATEVVSPTFLLVQEYTDAAGVPIYHYDLYRLKQAEDLWELGMEEALEQGVSLVEWPDNVMYEWPDDRLEIQISHIAGSETARSLVVRTYGHVIGKVESLLQHWQEKSRP